MRRCFYSVMLIALWIFAPWVYAQEPTLAFPGAEGFGRFAKGGRGGRVIAVTNLNDSGPGSLRDALEAEGPRIVVFRVGGTIELQSEIQVKSFVTVAGQTAPGDGIAIRGAGLNINKAQHVILRHLRIRPGPEPFLNFGIRDSDAIRIKASSKDIMIDHCSLSWALDEVLDIIQSSQRVTVQWSIISEGIYSAKPGTLPSSTYGMIGGSQASQASVHHSLFAHNFLRNPKVSNGTLEFINNVVYNSGNNQGNPYVLLGIGDGVPTFALHLDVIKNRFLRKPGLNAGFGVSRHDRNPLPDVAKLYVEGNFGDLRTDPSQPDSTEVKANNHHILVSSRVAESGSVTETDAFTAFDQVLAGVGATFPRRDPVDVRIIQDVRNGTGRIIGDPSDVGVWPILASGTPSADTDGDGMPDGWEVRYSFNPNDPVDGPQDANGNGYTNIEEYLNGTNPRDKGFAPAPPTNVRADDSPSP